jgi:hypothetical protein
VTDEANSPVGGSWQREAALAAGLLAFGAFALPFAIYLVGQQLLGDYAEGAGPLALAENIWLDLLALRLPAWILVLSPYVIVQLARAVRRTWRRRL